MSVDRVKEFFKPFGLSEKIMEFEESSATVELAAIALHVKGERIAKTLSFRKDDGVILVVTAGDAKIDNRKFKTEFNFKARMLSPEEVTEKTGHSVGGVCPFALPKEVGVFLDISLKRFKTVFPACGSNNSAIELTCEELFGYANAKKWVDVCSNWS